MTRRLPLLFFCLLTGCQVSPVAPRVGLPFDNMRSDDGTISGSWRVASRDGRRIRNGYLLTIDLAIGTFAVQRGCLGTGGTLMAVGERSYRIGRYDSGFAAEGCPPWKAVPELAPFDGAVVSLVRSGSVLTAGAGKMRLTFERLRLR